MEFISENEVYEVLKEFGIERVQVNDDRIELQMHSDDSIVQFHLASKESQATPHDGSETITIEKERLSNVVEHMLHLMHVTQILLIPLGKWRSVFDAVAFSLAESEAWQAVDAAATVELNRRDPLLCEPADFSTINELISALFNDAESPDQGLMLVSSSAPILIEIVPDGALRVSIGNQVLADEVSEAFAVS
ncbi:MAG: hypothetical protein IH891_01425 [Planctomycetes bacterium]|nr:hypothetical protein [Planctomycetota bacterium]MCH7602288.1 hypothetical protein [Planctomycetota bacterium]